ncbi:hypothetical protein OS493_010863 [Desmophyllum pertusum]|uniref:Uncharacterized protein n=1 Tax=Desmophyllum pertusum TaxID=174260 RepID=A0A9W9ZEK0_9CNID|nr:hypothetical protein OS493_010863 [Desmophyllum pertusum]
MPRSPDGIISGVVAEHFLVPLRLAESVLDFTDHDATSWSLVEALRMLSLAEYFSGNVESLQERDKNTLRRLPFYQATHGGLISLNSESVCVLPFDIPRKEMDDFGRRVNVVFLETWPSLSQLFKFLSFQCVSAIDVYRNFILKYFGIFSKDARLAHLEYIRDSILPMKSSDNQSLLDCLRNTAIVTSEDGTLKKASSYYDPHYDVFSIMLSVDKFPPNPFNTQEWLPFLKNIGLICEVSQDLFKTFARDVAREGATQRNTKTDAKSKLLVKHLFSRENVVEEGLLHAVCDVRFVATDPVKQELREIHRPFGEEMEGKTPYIAFKGSVLSEHTKIVWTTAALLPNWANAKKYQYHMTAPGWKSTSDYCNAILAHLQVLTVPTVDLVTFHCQNVSCQLAKENGSEVAPRQQCTRVSVMTNIYRFLQAKAVSSAVAKERLEHTPCVLVENGQRFVFAKQVVMELYKSLEIKPFLYGMPAELSEFATLFKYLGCSPSVTPSHYAMVLDMLHGQCKTNRLHPNEVDSALGAVKGLFETLQDTSEAKQDISTLYLPATSPFSSSFDVLYHLLC